MEKTMQPLSLHYRFNTDQKFFMVLQNVLKDRIRMYYDIYELTTDKEQWCAEQLDAVMQQEKHQAKTDQRAWTTHHTYLGKETTLSPYGKWVADLYHYYVEASDRWINIIIRKAMERAG
jgi:hypothetical protein